MPTPRSFFTFSCSLRCPLFCASRIHHPRRCLFHTCPPPPCAGCAAQVDDGDAPLPGLELRLCPKCRVRIEKNAGCDSMACYRCGEKFSWSGAQLVKATRAPLFFVFFFLLARCLSPRWLLCRARAGSEKKQIPCLLYQ